LAYPCNSAGFGRITNRRLLARADRIATVTGELSGFDDLNAVCGDRWRLAVPDLPKPIAHRPESQLPSTTPTKVAP